MKRLAPLLILIVIVLLGAGFRLYRLDEKSLWSDEVATIASGLGHSIDPDAYRLKGRQWEPPGPIPAGVYLQKATTPHPEDLREPAGWLRHWERTARVLRDNVHPPLFFGLMGLWMEAFGISPDTLRLPAACFGILAIPLIYLLALRLSDFSLSCLIEKSSRQPLTGWQRQTFALLSAAFLAFSAYQVEHAQDARPYTLLLLLSLAAVTLALEIARRRGSGWFFWLSLSLTLTAGLYTQYFFALFAGWLLLMLAGFPLAARLYSGQFPAGSFRLSIFWMKLAACILLMILLWLPWLESFRAQMAFLKQAGHYTLGLWRPAQLPEKLWRIVCEFFLPGSPVGKIFPALVFLTLAGVEWRRLQEWRQLWQAIQAGNWRPSPVVAILSLWLVGIIGGQVGLDLLRGTHTATIRRYLLLAGPACYLLMAWIFVTMARRKAGMIAAGILSFALLALMIGDTTHRLAVAHTSSDEFKQAAAWIDTNRQPGDPVWVSRSGPMTVGMAYYLKPETPLLGLEGKALPAALPHRGRVWLVFSHAAPSTRNRLERYLSGKSGKGYHAVLSRKFPGVRVALWTDEKN